MLQLRRMLGPIAGTWLFCQTAGLMATPFAISVAFDADLIRCTCADGDHDVCPMHHRQASPAPCSIRATFGDMALLSSILTSVGVLASAPTTITPAPAGTVIRDGLTPSSFRPAAPDPPPPRA
jgi:hypothetical protein